MGGVEETEYGGSITIRRGVSLERKFSFFIFLNAIIKKLHTVPSIGGTTKEKCPRSF